MATTTLAPHVLAIDDDAAMRQVIADYLGENELRVTTVATGAEMEKVLADHAIDLVVLDLRLGGEDGMQLAKKLRETSEIPIIVVSGRRDEADRVMALELGADDYITKPFSQRLLLERIRALLRRNEAGKAEGSGTAPGGVMTRGDLVLDETKHQCTWKGQDIQLTVTEFLLVKALAARPGMVKSRDQLIDAAYGENIYVDDRTIDSHIKRIRKKFRVGTEEFTHIETLYGIGYRYKEQ
jgi:two-component system, OmpR family, response regulator ChvI